MRCVVTDGHDQRWGEDSQLSGAGAGAARRPRENEKVVVLAHRGRQSPPPLR